MRNPYSNCNYDSYDDLLLPSIRERRSRYCDTLMVNHLAGFGGRRRDVAPVLLGTGTMQVSGPANPFLFNNTITAGANLVIVAVGGVRNADRTFGAVTYGGNAMSKVVSEDNDASDRAFAAICWLFNPPSGSQVVSVSLNEGNADSWKAITFSLGNASSSPVPVTDHAEFAGIATKTLNLTTVRKTFVVYCRIVGRGGSYSFIPGSDLTEVLDDGGGDPTNIFVGKRENNPIGTFGAASTANSTGAGGDAAVAAAFYG